MDSLDTDFSYVAVTTPAYPAVVSESLKGIGIFLMMPSQPWSSAPKSTQELFQDMHVENQALHWNLEGQAFAVALRPSSVHLLRSMGGVLCLTNEEGLPWLSLELNAPASNTSNANNALDDVGTFSL